MKQLSEQSGGALDVEWNDSTGTPRLLKGRLSAPSEHTPEWIAGEFVRDYRALYGLSDPDQELVVSAVDRSDPEHIRVLVRHELLHTPVWGDTLRMEINHQGVIQRVEGEIHPELAKQSLQQIMRQTFSEEQAIAVAEAYMIERQLSRAASKPDVARYYLPTRAGTPLVYAVRFAPAQQEGTDGGRLVLVHALTCRVIHDEPIRFGQSVTKAPSDLQPAP
ncbi:hypothetical protein [Paenibacillus koleovorans]|uniref:hypothetical protein n=1 Tax=Paenibacillus koleovorans TaxID=121608 RepID=UPI000FDC723B|nr:hypothetical protein [Paenibacillus koleovorans]